MTKITSASVSGIWETSISLSSLKTFEITVDEGITLKYIYGCIHEIGKEKEGIKTQQIIEPEEGVFHITLDTSYVSEKNGFQIFGFRESSDGSKEVAVGLIGNSRSLCNTSTLHLGVPTSGKFPVLSS